MTATANDQKTGRAVAGEELFESLAHFVVIHNGQSPDRAERIADQAVAFLVTAATATVPMVPSDDVDLGLHALILHTKEYAELCERYAGRFLHHNPKPGGGARDPEKVATSARAMKAAGSWSSTTCGPWTARTSCSATRTADDRTDRRSTRQQRRGRPRLVVGRVRPEGEASCPAQPLNCRSWCSTRSCPRLSAWSSTVGAPWSGRWRALAAATP